MDKHFFEKLFDIHFFLPIEVQTNTVNKCYKEKQLLKECMFEVEKTEKTDHACKFEFNVYKDCVVKESVK